MTTEEKRAELEAAGVKVRANASEERIDEMFAEYLALREGDPGPEGEEGEGGEDAVFTNEGTGEKVTLSDPVEANAKWQTIEVTDKPAEWAPMSDSQSNFLAFLEAHQDKMLGDKTPIVVEWARANLSPEEFKARYEGRTLA